MRAHAPLHTTHARSTAVTGGFDVDLGATLRPTGAVSGSVEVVLQSFGSGNALLDMQTLRVLNARRFPSARLTITAARPLATPGRARVEGTIAFHGVERPAAADVTIEGDASVSLTVSGQWQLSQREFGVKPPRLAMLKVDDVVKVAFRLVALLAHESAV